MTAFRQRVATPRDVPLLWGGLRSLSIMRFVEGRLAQ
jgi:hypothetical protein